MIASVVWTYSVRHETVAPASRDRIFRRHSTRKGLQTAMPSSVVTGITGQDGAYLAQHLLESGHTVYGTFRRTSSVNFWRLEELGIQNHPSLHLVEYDLTDLGTNIALVQKVQPDEIYNLAAQSFVGVSFDQPTTT